MELVEDHIADVLPEHVMWTDRGLRCTIVCYNTLHQYDEFEQLLCFVAFR